MVSNAPRLPAVQPLSRILPAGTEGGKEFARIAGLLLFQDAKRHGREFTLFDDASGDYEGLDSFSRPPKGDATVGYQYKFFPSPLSDSHRSEIANAVARTAAKPKKLNLEKYVVVTPDDLKNSARRSNGGDVQWFESLRDEYKSQFEIEHFGHSKLQSLFLQTPHLCLYYYPSLVAAGSLKRKSILEIRSIYDTSLKTRFGRIEFVGMSVYKEEASRRIPLEKIYIPLSVVPERAPEENEDTPRANPISFLAPGARTVVLGDPGSGKSTLMAFLALAGISETLQMRCGAVPDDRLTIVVTLRRYADELKRRRNLSLLEYVVEVTQADFSINSFDKDFVEFYLESGRCVLLFDGLDELPGSKFKSIVRQRIESFNSAYPANTIIITSRIVGYEAEVRFGDSYDHFRVAKLRTPEIERFISDWYTARLDDENDRDKNSTDLIKVITNPDNDAIRDLARNPLLLTIVALVHRIDAVLPDQRVVLYQKCTETLLNTWHNAKKGDEELAKGRIERRNRLRVEAIAYWMHQRSLEEAGRAVAPHSDILTFLTNYIKDNEPAIHEPDPAEDQAEVFLEFIKSGAGLLIEAGDGLYSFIHLTFQEYLTATHLTSNGEIGGAQAIWDELGGNFDNPRWREVVRLLVASLRSTMGQRFFIEKLLASNGGRETRDSALLLLGLLRDGIEPAEEEAQSIIRHSLRAHVRLTNIDDVRSIQGALKAWVEKHPGNVVLAQQAAELLQSDLDAEGILALALTCSVVGLDPLGIQVIPDENSASSDRDVYECYRSLILNENITLTTAGWKRVSAVGNLWATESPEGNLAAVANLAISIALDTRDVPNRLLNRELILLATAGYGPHSDHILNLLAIALPNIVLPPQVFKALENAMSDRAESRTGKSVYMALLPHMNGLLVDEVGSNGRPGPNMMTRIRNTLKSKVKRGKAVSDLAQHGLQRFDERRNYRQLSMIRSSSASKLIDEPGSYWRMALTSDVYEDLIFPSLLVNIPLAPKVHWQEGLRVSLATKLPAELAIFLHVDRWAELEHRLRNDLETHDDLDLAAWLMLIDVWTWEHGGYSHSKDSPFQGLADAANGRTHAALQFALCVRGCVLGFQECQAALSKLTSQHDAPIVDLLVGLGWRRPRYINGRLHAASSSASSKSKAVLAPANSDSDL